MNYYNENDPKAAAWLRELIKARLIPAGDVDERSIVDVKPHELTSYTQCHFFAGIAGWSYALKLAGWPEDEPVWTGSCPCQPLSCAGQRKGHADERHLWPAFYGLISKCKPATVFGEQVASKDGREWLAGIRADLEGAGYAVGAADLPAAGVGAPHKRQRIFWVANIDGARRKNTPRRTGQAWQDGWKIAPSNAFGYGVSRRIPEPGFCIVADGLSACPPVVRGYGNAIVPQVAAAFIQAAVESLNLERTNGR